MNFKGKTKYVICAVFLIIIFGVFILNLLTSDKSFSDNENRVLSGRPAFSMDSLLSGEYTSDFEEYVNDQFIGRDAFIALKSVSELLSGKPENSGVYFAQDKLIEVFSKVNETLLSDNVAAVSAFAKSQAVPVALALIPTAQEIYKDELEYGAPCVSERELIDRAYSTFGGASADILDALSSHSGEYIFYRTDHHWTSLGAYYGYTAICDTLGIESAALSGYDKTILSEEFNGTLYSKSGARFITPDEIDAYVSDEGTAVVRYDAPQETLGGLYFREYLSQKDKYKVFLGGNCGRVIVRTKNHDLPKLLMIRDSYADSLTPYLTGHFSEIHLLDLRYYKNSVTEYIEENDIDNVLIIYGTKKFSEDTNIRAFLK